MFSDRSYSLLLVSASEQFNNALSPLLQRPDYYPVTVVPSLREAERCQAADPCDLLLVNAPVPVGDALRFCRKQAADTDAGILLLIRREQAEALRLQAEPAGILTLAKPLSSQLLEQALYALRVQRERLRSREESKRNIEETIEELQLVNRAKWLLIQCLNMTEDDAHRYIVRLSMQQQRTRREIAEGIIRTYAQ